MSTCGRPAGSPRPPASSRAFRFATGAFPTASRSTLPPPTPPPPCGRLDGETGAGDPEHSCGGGRAQGGGRLCPLSPRCRPSPPTSALLAASHALPPPVCQPVHTSVDGHKKGGRGRVARLPSRLRAGTKTEPPVAEAAVRGARLCWGPAGRLRSLGVTPRAQSHGAARTAGPKAILAGTRHLVCSPWFSGIPVPAVLRDCGRSQRRTVFTDSHPPKEAPKP